MLAFYNKFVNYFDELDKAIPDSFYRGMLDIVAIARLPWFLILVTVRDEGSYVKEINVNS